MTSERVWLYHVDTGHYFHCPVAAAEAWQARGWQPSDPPPEPMDPALQGLVAWEQTQKAEQEKAKKPAKKTVTKTIADTATDTEE